jgi:hypothetical protein
LKPIGLRLRPFQDLMAGDSGRERTGREVQAPACVQPRALFHGFLFRAGAVASGRIEEASAALGDTKAVLEETPCAEGVGSVFLREGATRRLLFTYDDSNCPRARIRWVGDLDRDGQLDLLVEQAGDGTGLWLFLSSQGKSAAEWRAAASTYHGGC